MENGEKFKISAERIKESREKTISESLPEIANNGKPKRRKKKTLTQTDLANLVGCDPNYICMLESGKYPLTFEMAYKIAKVCSVTPEYLLGKSDNKHYTGDVLLAISKMQRYVQIQNDFIEFICFNANIDESQLSEAEKDILIKDVEWYATARLKKTISEKGEKNG